MRELRLYIVWSRLYDENVYVDGAAGRCAALAAVVAALAGAGVVAVCACVAVVEDG